MWTPEIITTIGISVFGIIIILLICFSLCNISKKWSNYEELEERKKQDEII